MPKFFLHIADDGHNLPDTQEITVADLGAARDEAFRVIGELLDAGTWNRVRHVANHIDIVDENGTLLDTVAVWEVTSRPG